MTNTLTFHRQFLDAQSQSSAEIYRNDPFITALHSEISLPSFVVMSVKDAGIFMQRDGQTNEIFLETQFDEYGRPTLEEIENHDRGSSSAREWFYHFGNLDYDTVTSEGEEQRLWSYRWLDVNTHQFDDDGKILDVTQRDLSDGTVIEVRVDNTLVEEATYNNDGRLSRVETGQSGDSKRIQTYFYDAHGGLIRIEKNPGMSYSGGRNNPDITEYEHADGRVVIQGHNLGVPILDEVRVYDEKGRPISISSKQGAVDLGKVAINTKIQYSEQSSFLESFAL